MVRPVLIGAGLGLLLLATVAGALWFAGGESRRATPLTSSSVLEPRVAPQAQPAAPSLTLPRSGPAVPTREAKQEQRRRLAQVRAEFDTLRAQGAAASPEKMRAVIDELEALSPPGLDKRYFQTLRDLLDISAQVQKLSQELQALSSSKTPQDVARREALLKEVQALSERAQVQAQNLQTYASAAAQAKSP